MAIVRFNVYDEFLAELTKDIELVDRRIVRITNLYQGSTVSPSLKHLSVVATAKVGVDIVRLDVYCGDVWGLNTQHNDVTRKKAQDIQHRITQAGAQLGFEIRAGILEAEERQ